MWRDWEEIPLKSIANARKGALITEATAIHGSVPVIAGGMTPSYFHNRPNRPSNTITISASGANAGYVGFHSYPIYASDCSTIEENEVYDIKFLYYLLSSKQADITKMQAGGAQPHVYPENVNNLTIYYPPEKEEQKAIAEVLDTVDEAIAATQAMLEKQDKIKDGLLQDLLTRGVDASGTLRPCAADAPNLYKPSPLGLIPKEWDVKSFEHSSISIIDGDRGEHYPSAGELLEDGHCVFLNASNVTKRGFKFETIDFITAEKDSKLRKGKLVRDDVILTTRGTVGNFAYFDESIPYEHIRINSGMVILRNNEKNLDTKFFFYSFGSFIFVSENQRSGSGSAQPQLPIKDLLKFNFIKPSPDEQHLINARVDGFMEKYRLTQVELTKLKKLKAGLMQDLLTGKKRVPSALKEAA